MRKATDDLERFRRHVRRAIRGEPDPEHDREIEEQRIRAAALRAAHGLPSVPAPSKRIH